MEKQTTTIIAVAAPTSTGGDEFVKPGRVLANGAGPAGVGIKTLTDGMGSSASNFKW